MLRVENLSAWYGEAHVLRGIGLEVGEGEVVTLMGRNGAGKTTLLRAVMGLHPQTAGRIAMRDAAGRYADLVRLPAYRRARLGLGWVPDDRGTYAGLSVQECLSLPPKVGPAPWSLEEVYGAFPVLYERRSFPSTRLSGGEQQMLALARVLRMGARLLLCDEPTEGLSPLVVQQVGAILGEIKRRGVAVLLVEQNLRFAATVADRHYLLDQGGIAETMDNSQVRTRERELLAYLGI